jgi:lipopolysaccharide assembly outer membrane protein LptD (OstA)
LAGSLTKPYFYKNSIKLLRTNLFYIVLLTFFLTIGSVNLYSQDAPKKSQPFPAKNQPTTVKKEEMPAANKLEISELKADTIKLDSLKPKKKFLEGKVKYRAKDSAKFDQKKKLITLYNEAELYYQDYELKSGIIVFDYQKNEVYAGRIKDSTGKYTQLPYFKQGSNIIEPDSIRFNYKTKKALVWNSRTTQNELNIKAEVTKKENDSVYFMRRAKITTATNIEDPEYYFLVNRGKLVPGKKVVVGLTEMYIYDVPTPVILPFAFFPITEKSTSGIIIPNYNYTNQRGYTLQNGGYYFALSDNYDLAILGDYYTNGSYAMRFESNYAKRYKYNGRVNFRFEDLINSERGFPDYSKTKIYNIQWSHSKDAKSNPNSRFSASVNLGSSKYFQQSLNQVNVGSNLNNTLSSSISYSKTFNTVPQVNFSVAATHSQNTQTEQINMTLPTLQASVERIFPFAPKDGVKKGFFKNINLQYNLRGENRIATTDSLFFKKEMFDTALTGFEHTIPLSTNFKIFKYLSASTSFNYREVWQFKTVNKTYDSTLNELVNTDVGGFDAFRTYTISNSLGTTIYGTFNFGEKKKIKSIRHVMRPSVSHSYAPSFSKYYDTYDSDGSGTMIKEYTRFEGGVFGAPSNYYSNNVGFSLSNTFEAKVTDRDSTKTEPKKIMLLNNLNFSTSYDMAADSLRWAPMRISGGTQLFKQKMNINFATTLDPYSIDNNGRRMDKFNIDNGGSLFRMTSANMTMNFSLVSTDFGKSKKDKDGKENKQGARNGGREDDLFGTNTDFSDRRESQFSESEDEDEEEEFIGFYKSELPWDLNLAYSITYGNNNRENEIISNSLMISANTTLTPKWKIGISTGYDFVQKGVTFTQLRFERDLLSWRMDFNWVPFGDYTYWGFFVGIKSGVLSDIKWDKNSQPDKRLR